MSARFSPAETLILLLAELVVIAAGAAGLIGPNWELAGLVAGILATLVGAALWRARNLTAGPALGAGLGLLVSQTFILATSWGDEELTDPLVFLGAFALLVGAAIGTAIQIAAAITRAISRAGRRTPA